MIKGSKASESFKKKRSLIMIEKWKDKKFRKLMSEKHKGRSSWNKGLTKETDTRLKSSGGKISNNKERNKKQSITKKRLFKEGKLINSFKGKKHSEKTKRKIRKKSVERGALKGENNPWYNNGRFGELNPMWKGGKSFEPYTKEFNKKLKILIKERDNFTCQLCKTKKDLCVHHIDYNKKNCRPENLITLCRSCHSKTNTKRKYWEDYFNDKSI